MHITFLSHSGFFIELDRLCLLFDWWEGALPPLPDKPLLVFSSHAHDDHFQPKIFSLDDGRRDVRFLLGNDIPLAALPLSAETASRCILLGGEETLRLPENIRVETLPSTDEGVAFLVTVDETVVFHAGDLNWWHWEGEPDPWNPDMAEAFRRYAEPLRGRHIDLALLPLDSRLGEAGFWGARYFLELADIDRVIPMHQWQDFAFTDRFCREHPQFAAKVLPVTRNGQVFDL